eukprot:2785975-Pleurochrysis_carterae.AAC.4
MALIQESISEELMGHGEWAAARVRASVTDEYAPLAALHGELRSEKSTSDDEPAVVRELNETGAHGAAPRDLSRCSCPPCIVYACEERGLTSCSVLCETTF